MKWFSKPEAGQSMEYATFNLECMKCEGVFTFTAVVGIVQRAPGLCPACFWWLVNFQDKKPQQDLYLEAIRDNMIDTLNDWWQGWVER